MKKLGFQDLDENSAFNWDEPGTQNQIYMDIQDEQDGFPIYGMNLVIILLILLIHVKKV